MQTFTLTMGSWMHRLLVRNPLVRASDRIEAIVMFAALVSTVLVVPVAGAVGTSVYDSRIHTSAAERLTRHEVESTATQDSSVLRLPYQYSNLTTLQWQSAGHSHTEVVNMTHRLNSGERTPIWVDTAGDRTEPPLSDTDAVIEAVLAGLGLLIAVCGAGTVVCALLRFRLDRLRSAAWDRELDDLADKGRTNRDV